MLFRSVEADPFPRFSFPRSSPAPQREVAPSSRYFFTEDAISRHNGVGRVSPSGSTQRELESHIDPADWIASALNTPQPATTPTQRGLHLVMPPPAALPTTASTSPPIVADETTVKEPAVLRQWKQRLLTEANATAHQQLVEGIRVQSRSMGEFSHVVDHRPTRVAAHVPSYAQPTAS
ncbi:Hypothetical protein, putative, partial [Bodo saltans]